jgi:tetratricopeptide (TPR) repeat protein
LPESIRRSVEERVARAEEAAPTLRTAAVIGPDVDLDVLSGVTGLPPDELLNHLEQGVRRRFLVERGPRFEFAHALVREALASTVGAARTAFIHREAARVLSSRVRPDPLSVARHSRLGGDLIGAADALITAAHIAVSRFEADEALRLLNDAIALDDTAKARVERARVLTMLNRNEQVAADLQKAKELGAGPEVLEVAAWSAHFQRNLSEALVLADQGARDANSDELRTACLALGGWVALASGDLSGSEERLEEAVRVAPTGHAVQAESWLAWLRVSQGQPEDTVDLVHVSDGTGLAAYRYPNAYALMASTMAQAMLSRPDRALASLKLLESDIERMDAARWVPRSRNLRGWIARNLGEVTQGDECNAEAVEVSRQIGMAEPLAHGLLDLAAGRLMVADFAGTSDLLTQAQHLEQQEHAFKWRHRLRRRLLETRLQLDRGLSEAALTGALALGDDATALGATRHALQARLLHAVAAHRLGQPTDLAQIEALLGALPRLAGLESWWLTAEVAAEFGVAEWRALAEIRVRDLLVVAGPHEGSLRRAAAERFA